MIIHKSKHHNLRTTWFCLFPIFLLIYHDKSSHSLIIKFFHHFLNIDRHLIPFLLISLFTLVSRYLKHGFIFNPSIYKTMFLFYLAEISHILIIYPFLFVITQHFYLIDSLTKFPIKEPFLNEFQIVINLNVCIAFTFLLKVFSLNSPQSFNKNNMFVILIYSIIIELYFNVPSYTTIYLPAFYKIAKINIKKTNQDVYYSYIFTSLTFIISFNALTAIFLSNSDLPVITYFMLWFFAIFNLFISLTLALKKYIIDDEQL